MVRETKSESKMDLDKEMKCSVSALFKILGEQRKKNTLIDNGESVFLQVTIFKIPETDDSLTRRRITLKHPVRAPNPEVCLIVKDYIKMDGVKRSSDEMIDFTIEYYEEVLKKHKITGITSIMPYKQLKTEYDTYEFRRKLVNKFDIFLCDAFLCTKDHFFTCLGKVFMQKNKYPIAVKVPKLNHPYNKRITNKISSAINSTVFYIKTSSDNFSLCIGNTQHTEEQLFDNLKIAVDKIIQSEVIIPGGLQNIRRMHIKADRSKAVPFYISMASPNDIPVPYVKSNVPVLESVEDEISTLPGRKVTVLPDGQVFVNRMPRDDEDEDEDMDMEEDGSEIDDNENEEEAEDGGDGEEEEEGDSNEEEEEEERREDQKSKKKKKARKAKGKESEDGDEDELAEEAIESAEQMYLSNLNDESESEEEEVEEKPKQRPVTVKRKRSEDTSKYAKKSKKGKIVKDKPRTKTMKSKKKVKAC